jgi:hypothetical protein
MVFIAPSSVAVNPPKAEPPAKPTKTKLVASSNKKRRHFAIQARDSEDGEVIEEQRRQRNRDHARKSRLRKKSLTGSLQNSMEELKAENAKLREQIYAAVGRNKTDSMVEKTLATPTNKFVAGLKKPEHRVVDAETLSFLQGLRTKISPSTFPVQMVA